MDNMNTMNEWMIWIQWWMNMNTMNGWIIWIQWWMNNMNTMNEWIIWIQWMNEYEYNELINMNTMIN